MAYTTADRDLVKAALLALASGTRKVRLMMADKNIEYGQASIPELRQLLSDIESSLRDDDTKPKFVLTSSTSKGL